MAIPPYLTVKELAELMGVNPTDIISEMMKHNVLATINQQIDYETAAIAAIGLGYEVTEAKPEVEEDLGEVLTAEQEAADTASHRSPARSHDHGPRRPRQDQAARHDPLG